VTCSSQAVAYPNRGCDSRVYEYLLPSYTLLPPRPGTPLAQKLDASSPGWRDALSVPDAFWQDAEEGKILNDVDWKDMSKSERASIQDAKLKEAERWRGWRVDEASLNRFKEVIAGYKGTQCVFESRRYAYHQQFPQLYCGERL
jgi:tRNA pseudouridine38-40 synthase